MILNYTFIVKNLYCYLAYFVFSYNIFVYIFNDIRVVIIVIKYNIHTRLFCLFYSLMSNGERSKFSIIRYNILPRE